MVKLLRLSTTNDGKFNADLDAGIQLSENAQIAVQNLTFKTDFDVLKVNGLNGNVTVTWDTNLSTNPLIESMPFKEYTISNISELSADLQLALNSTQVVYTVGVGTNLNYGEFRVTEDNNTTLTDIQYKLCPLSLPFHMNKDGSRRTEALGNELFGITKASALDGSGDVPSLQIGDKIDAGGINLGMVSQNLESSKSTDKLYNFCFPTVPEGQFSNGAGIFYCDVRSLISNAGDAETNGFGIGLSFTDFASQNIDVPESDEILDEERDYEIRCRRPTDPYTFHANGIAGTSNKKPHKFSLVADPNPANHDLMIIERIGSNITGSIASVDSHLFLTDGNPWAQTPTTATENFDSTNITGSIANYRSVQVGGGIKWWEAVDSVNWNYYNSKPVAGDTPTGTAVADLATGVLTLDGTTTILTPTKLPITIGGVGGKKTEIFSVDIPAAKRYLPLHPYIYCCGSGVDAICGHPVITQHCLTDDNLKYERTGREQICSAGATPHTNAFKLLTSTNGFYGNVFATTLKDVQFENDTYSVTQNMTIKVNNEILRNLGYNVEEDNTGFFTFSNATPSRIRTTILTKNDNQCGYDLTAQVENAISLSDNYILMIDSNPVQSFDASRFDYATGAIVKSKQNNRGRQINILSTIPVNDNVNGVVEYQANELVYIDLDNKFPQVLKNIRLRILDKDFKEIRTLGTAILTLLIKDK